MMWELVGRLDELASTLDRRVMRRGGKPTFFLSIFNSLTHQNPYILSLISLFHFLLSLHSSTNQGAYISSTTSTNLSLISQSLFSLPNFLPNFPPQTSLPFPPLDSFVYIIKCISLYKGWTFYFSSSTIQNFLSSPLFF
jgi:hypothetical protein